jgi:hypothetical protein
MLSAADLQCIRMFTLYYTHTVTEPLLHQLHECRYNNRWQEGLRLLSVALGQSVEPSATVHAAVTAALPQTSEAYSALLDVYAKVSTISSCAVCAAVVIFQVACNFSNVFQRNLDHRTILA